jgi:serine/threonine protein phosphatase PrpC
MVTCPQCGENADNDTAYCPRCGQGLLDSANSSASASAMAPLEVGRVLRGEFEIVSLIQTTAHENRYRACRTENGLKIFYQLRERLGSSGAEQDQESAEESPVSQDADALPDPNAKTAELKPISAAIEAVAESAGVEAETAEVILDESEVVPETEVEAAKAVDANGSADLETPPRPDLGEVFGRVRALSQTLSHPAFQRAIDGFAENGRVYLVYADENLEPLSLRRFPLPEAEVLNVGIQLCQAVSFLHRRGLRLNDICPASVARSPDGRIKLTGLDYISNDDEIQAEPILNDGYTAPEVYRARKIDKRADIFSIGALLYTMSTGDRLEAETWREEAGAVTFYPPHVLSPQLEQVIRRAILFHPDERWANVDLVKAELARLASIIRIRSAALTDVGMVRELNEDVVMAVEYRRDSQVEPTESYLYVVCDGMGGAAAGEIAAAIAVSTIRNYVENGLSGDKRSDLCELLRSALEEANTKIIEYAAAHPESRGMGSTGVGLLIVPPQAAIAWVGDSRAYILDGAGLRQVTKDHSLVQRLIEIGQITPEEARHHEHKNVITRSLGARQSGPAGAETVPLRLKRGDRVMLCSDGLIAHVEDGKIAEILQRATEPYRAALELIVAANAGGGTDNISVIVLFVE